MSAECVLRAWSGSLWTPAPTNRTPRCSLVPCHTSHAPPISAMAANANSSDFCSPSRDQLLELADELGLHELAIEDAVGPHQRPKLDHYATHLFLSCHPIRVDPDAGRLDETEIEQQHRRHRPSVRRSAAGDANVTRHRDFIANVALDTTPWSQQSRPLATIVDRTTTTAPMNAPWASNALVPPEAPPFGQPLDQQLRGSVDLLDERCFVVCRSLPPGPVVGTLEGDRSCTWHPRRLQRAMGTNVG